MSHSMTRRDALTRTLVAFAAPGVTRGLAWGYQGESLGARLAELEKRSAGRLGCAVLNTSTGAVIAHRPDEPFPMCSTFKASAVAFVLQRAERRAERLDRRIVFSAPDILPVSPITKLHVGGNGMSAADVGRAVAREIASAESMPVGKIAGHSCPSAPQPDSRCYTLV